MTTNNLDKAKENLESASKYLPDGPRLELLWGHYYFLLGEQLENEKLPESQGVFQQAIGSYEQARKLNRGIADVHLYLGRAYEKVGRRLDAMNEYSEAAKLDEWNSDACMNNTRALFLSKQPAKARQEAARCQKLLSDIIENFAVRKQHATDTWARRWLQIAIDERTKSRKAFIAAVSASAGIGQAKEKKRQAAR